jgi:hypothetical protein
MTHQKRIRPSERVSPTAPESSSLSAAIWRHLEEQPGFNDQLREAEAELSSGGGVLYGVRDGALRKARRKG